MANLWTEFKHVTDKRGKERQRLQNAKKFFVAAIFETANTYVFAGLVIRIPRAYQVWLVSGEDLRIGGFAFAHYRVSATSQRVSKFFTAFAGTR